MYIYRSTPRTSLLRSSLRWHEGEPPVRRVVRIQQRWEHEATTDERQFSNVASLYLFILSWYVRSDMNIVLPSLQCRKFKKIGVT